MKIARAQGVPATTPALPAWSRALPPASRGLPPATTASGGVPRPAKPVVTAASAPPITTIGPHATMEAPMVHASRDTVIERYRTSGKVQIQGGGRAGADLRAALRTVAPTTTAPDLPDGAGAPFDASAAGKPGGGSPTVYSVPSNLRPVSFNLNDQTATAPNVTNTQGGTAEASLLAGIDAINAAAGQTLIAPTLGTTSERNAANDGNNIISFVQGNYRFSKNTVAVNINYLSGSQIVSQDVLFNPKQPFSTDNSGSVEQSTFDVQGVGTHEMLHAVGLPHISSDPQATMYPSVSRTDDVKLRTLEQSDIAELLLRYPAPTA